ncbi:hypothetical protein V1517DRAFT_305614 [Lipomyces orientalis]|uniref:Uncharacterized protein n=1 Tax=Lipomyces orientalis TaxID=1233043 RepID=A0ACC3TXP4_9ASCO
MREVFPKYKELEAERQQQQQLQSTQGPSQAIVSPPMAQHADVVMNPSAGLQSPSEVSAQMASHITSANLFEASPEAVGMHSGAGGYATAHPARNGMLQTSQTTLQSPSRTPYLDQSGVANVRQTPQLSRSAPPAKRARTDGASAVPANLTPAGRQTNVNMPGGLMIDADALGAAVKIVTESIKQVFESSGSANPLGRSLSPAAGQPGSPTLIGSNTSDANVRFQSAVKLLSRMRRDLRWTKEQYKHALAVLRQLDESGVILLLEMDEDAREDFVLSEF